MKQRKGGAVLAISLTRHTKLLAEKHEVAIKDRGSRGSMKGQGTALQTEFAQWLQDRGIEAERGKPKVTRGDDWQIPEVVGAAKDREQAAKDRAGAEAARAQIWEAAGEIMPKAQQEAAALLAAAKAEAQSIREAAKAQGWADAKADADQIRGAAQTEADQLKAGLDARERTVGEREDAVSDRETDVGDREKTLKAEKAAAADHQRALNEQEAELSRQRTELATKERDLGEREQQIEAQEGRLAELLKQLEPVLKPLQELANRVKKHLDRAPESVRAWLHIAGGPVREAVQEVKKLSPLMEQAQKAVAAREAARAAEAVVAPERGVGPSGKPEEEEDGVSPGVQAAFLGKGGKWRG